MGKQFRSIDFKYSQKDFANFAKHSQLQMVVIHVPCNLRDHPGITIWKLDTH